jgi:hypothetical protein
MANGQVAAGHKANLNNPNTSEESKQHSRAVLNENENENDNESYENEDHDSGSGTLFCTNLFCIAL